MSKVDIVLCVFAAVVMVAIRFIYPHTYLGKVSYNEQRVNAINYINAVRYENDEGYEAEVERLIGKYDLEEMYSDNTTQLDRILRDFDEDDK